MVDQSQRSEIAAQDRLRTDLSGTAAYPAEVPFATLDV
jgi:hypothetical protein